MKFYKILFLWFALLSLATPHSLLAATFDPNFLISDEEMQNWQSMNRGDIQAFLTEKGGFIATYSAPDKNGVDRPASEIIYRASVDNKINPKYVLVKLQKEQSLITHTNPTQKQLDWATGYGVCDSCSMNDPAIQKHKGFGIQVDSAAAIIRWYYDNVQSQTWIKRAQTPYLIDNTPVTPANLATAFLYTYTPHIQGNQNFWKLWQDWFDQVYPNGSLIKTADSPDVYLIQNGEKRKFKSATALTTRFDPKLILQVPQSELARYADGKDIALPNYAIVFDGITYYLLDYDFKRPFENREVLRQLGFNPEEIIDVTPDEIASYDLGKTISGNSSAPLGRLIQTTESKNLYFVEDGVMHPIFDPAIAQVNFPHLAIEKMSASQLASLNLTFGSTILLKDGTLFGIKGYTEIYVIENGKKRHIASEAVFNGLGYNAKNIIWISEYVGMAHETGEPIYLRNATTPNTAVAQTSSVIVPQKPTQTISPETSTIKNPVDLMVRTPADQVSYTGKIFETPVDAYVVMDYDTGTIHAAKNDTVVRPLASLTKLMTAKIIIDKGLPLQEATTYQAREHKSAYHRYAIAEGDRILNKDIFYSMLVSSNNTAAVMLARTLGYSIEEFATLMNAEAQKLGLTGMSFVESYGYNIKNQGSARDVANLFREILKNDTIASALGTPSHNYSEITSVDDTTSHTESNSNALLRRTGLPYRILASKTGFLHESGSCLVLLVERPSDNKKFILVTMGNPDFGTTTRFDEPSRFASWAVSHF